MLLFFVKGVKGGNVIPPDNVTTTKFNGNFNSKRIRELWQVCSFTFQQRHPELPQDLRWTTCDCYLDTIRETLSPDKVMKMTPAGQAALTKSLIKTCNGIMDVKPSIMT